MKKSELISELRNRYPFLNTEQVRVLIELIFLEIANNLKEGKRIELRGLGSFSLRDRKVQLNFPSDKDQEISTKQIKSVYFRMGKDFFSRLNLLNEK
jgi:integration host factor subunit beta